MPNRWRFQWTGPHKVIKRLTGRKSNLYEIRHNESARSVTANVNRLSLHIPWDEKHECTGSDPFVDQTDAKRWSTEGKASVGSLIAFRLSDEEYPFGVGTVLERNSSEVKFQWLWNETDNAKGVLKRGWVHKTKHHVLYRDSLTKKMEEEYDPYTETGIPVTDDDVVVHGFRLKADGRLPTPVLQILSDDPTVRWQLAPIQQPE